MKVKLDLSNYAIKADLKNVTSVDASKFAKKIDLASLKSEVDKLDIDKLEKIPTDLTLIRLGFLGLVFSGGRRGGREGGSI